MSRAPTPSSIWKRTPAGSGGVRIQDRHLPEDADILEPRRALDERSHVQAVRAGRVRRLDAELEPGDLSRADIVGRLDRDAIPAWPAGGRRAALPVATEDARLVLARLACPRAEVRDLAHATGDPAPRSRVEVRERRGRALAGAELHVAALSVPGRVESGELCRDDGGRRDAGAGLRHAGRGRGCGGLRRERGERASG